MSDGEGRSDPAPEVLEGIARPTTKETRLEDARVHGADETVLAGLQRLSTARCDGPNAVSEALGEAA